MEVGCKYFKIIERHQENDDEIMNYWEYLVQIFEEVICGRGEREGVNFQLAAIHEKISRFLGIFIHRHKIRSFAGERHEFAS